MREPKRVQYYTDFDQDFVETRDQGRKLPEDYRFIRKNPFYIVASYLVYYVTLVIAFVYIKCVLRARMTSRKKMRKAKKAVIYANHTLSIADALAPFLYCFPRRPYVICDTANLGIPVIGRFLPIAGAIPIPDNLRSLVRFNSAVETRIKQGHPVVIYPEAHIWPYCDFIRPFQNAAFHYVSASDVDVFTMTTTFQENGDKKPRVKLVFDGPIRAVTCKNRRERIKLVKNLTHKNMERCAKENNTTNYIKYIKK